MVLCNNYLKKNRHFMEKNVKTLRMKIVLYKKFDRDITSMFFKGGHSGQMTQQFLNILELFSP